MLEGNIFNSGGHGSSSGKRAVWLLVAVGVVAAVALAAGGVGGIVQTAASGQGGGASAGTGAGAAAPAFPGMAAGFVLLLVGMLVVILRM
jgi:hypothetical protein